jgi:hypothetical protein
MPPLRSQYFFYSTLLILGIKLHRSYQVFNIWLCIIRNSSPCKWNQSVWILSNSSTDRITSLFDMHCYLHECDETTWQGHRRVRCRSNSQGTNCTNLTSTTLQVFTSFTVNICNTHRFGSIWNTSSYMSRITKFEDEKPVIWWNKKFNGNSDELQLVCSFLYGGEIEHWGTWRLFDVLGVSDVAIM